MLLKECEAKSPFQTQLVKRKGKKGKEPLLVPKRLHRIQAGSAPRGNQRGYKGRAQEGGDADSKDRWVKGLDSEQLAFDIASAQSASKDANCDSNKDHQKHLAHDEEHDASWLRSQSHADSDFSPATRHDEGQNPVESNNREQGGQHRHPHRKKRKHAFVRKAHIELVVESAHVGNYEIWIHAPDFGSQLRQDLPRIPLNASVHVH